MSFLEAYALATAGLAVATTGAEVGLLVYSRAAGGDDDPPGELDAQDPEDPPGDHGGRVDEPSISVIIPAYREGGTVLGALDSVADLDYPRDRLEAVLALERDDRRTAGALEGAGVQVADGSESIYRGIRVKVAFNGSGVRSKPAALDSALGVASGEVIAICDAEDVLDEPAAREAVDVLDGMAGAAAVQFARDTRNPEEGGALTIAQHVELEANNNYFIPAVGRITGFVPLLGSGYFIRREALEDVGGWDPMSPAEDLDLTFRLYGKGYSVAFVRGALVHTLAVTNVWGLIRQRERWIRGTLLLMPKALRLLSRAWPILVTYMLSPIAWILAETWPIVWALRPELLPILAVPSVLSFSLYLVKLRLQGKGAGFMPLVSLAYAVATWVAVVRLAVSPRSWTKTR